MSAENAFEFCTVKMHPFVLVLALYKFASTSKLFIYFNARYSQHLIRELNRLLRLRAKLTRTLANIAFLKNCLESYVTPPHIVKRVQRAKPKHPVAIERAFLKDELDKHQDCLQWTNEDYYRIFPSVFRQLSSFDKLRFCKLLTQNSARLMNQIRAKKNKMLEWLIRSQRGQGELDHSTVINLSGVELTETQKDILCRGLSFGVPPRMKNFDVLVEAEFELCWQQLGGFIPKSDEKAQDCKLNLAHLCRKYANLKPDMAGYPLHKQHFALIEELKKNQDLVITRPDKGNGVVLLRRSDYVEKMERILGQVNKFTRIGDAANNDSTVLQERALQAFLLRACRNGHISEEVYDRIRPVGSSRPRMYGLPKLHKQDVPLRPILSMTNAPQHAMAKWLTEVLQPVLKKYSEHTVKDSFDFCTIIQGFESDWNLSQTFMCSFDIKSLFTNIPLDRTIQICLDTLYRDEDIAAPSIPESLLKKMLLKATTDVEFSFDGSIYRQIDGVAMGSPLGPVLANIFVGFCESEIDAECWPLLYCRFVDDTFSIFNTEAEACSFFRRLNDLHPDLQFTMERETENRLPFMDVSIERVGNDLVRSIYRKLTFTGLYTRWDSFAPTGQKISLIKSLASRALRICSVSTLPEELRRLSTIFVKNGYPSNLVDKIIRGTTVKREVTNDGVDLAEGQQMASVFIRLPWMGSVSNKFRKDITAAITGGFVLAKPRVVFSTTTAFSGRVKDPLPTTWKSSLVYCYRCSCARTYVGKTVQNLSERIKQHIPPKLLLPGADLRRKSADSGITRHLKDNSACLEKLRKETVVDRFSVLYQARNRIALDVLEALFIHRLAPELCSQKEHVRVLTLC